MSANDPERTCAERAVGCGEPWLAACQTWSDRQPPLAERHVSSVHALAMDGERCEGGLHFAEVGLCQHHGARTMVLVEVGEAPCAGDRHDERPLSQKPSQRKLRRGRPLLGCL